MASIYYKIKKAAWKIEKKKRMCIVENIIKKISVHLLHLNKERNGSITNFYLKRVELERGLSYIR
jgi:hypothetical protein